MRRVFVLFSPGRLVLAACLLVAGYMLVSAGGNFLASHQLARNESELQQQVAALRVQEQQLQQIRDYLRTNEYVEYMARRVFGLVKPGETLVVVNSPPMQEKETEPGLPWWDKLFLR